MSVKQYVIPDFLLQYVKQFANEIPFYHRAQYNNNFPTQGDLWLKQTQCDRHYLLHAVRHGYTLLPVVCKSCGKRLELKHLYGNRPNRKYCFCSSKCSRNDQDTKDKFVKTCVAKYGCSNPQQNKHVQEKRYDTLIEQYGSVEQWRANNCRNIRKNRVWKFLDQLKKHSIELVTEINTFINTAGSHPPYEYQFHCLECDHHWLASTNLHQLRCPSCVQRGKSAEENAVKRALEAITNQPLIFNDRSVISPFEADIYIPSENVIIEYNGSWTHRVDSNDRDSNYHFTKSKLAFDNHLFIKHIFDWQWLDYHDAVINEFEILISKNTQPIPLVIQPIDKTQYDSCNQKWNSANVFDHSTERYGIFANTLVAIVGVTDDTITNIAINHHNYYRGMHRDICDQFNVERVTLRFDVHNPYWFIKGNQTPTFTQSTQYYVHNRHYCENDTSQRGLPIQDSGIFTLSFIR